MEARDGRTPARYLLVENTPDRVPLPKGWPSLRGRGMFLSGLLSSQSFCWPHRTQRTQRYQEFVISWPSAVNMASPVKPPSEHFQREGAQENTEVQRKRGTGNISRGPGRPWATRVCAPRHWQASCQLQPTGLCFPGNSPGRKGTGTVVPRHHGRRLKSYKNSLWSLRSLRPVIPAASPPCAHRWERTTVTAMGTSAKTGRTEVAGRTRRTRWSRTRLGKFPFRMTT